MGGRGESRGEGEGEKEEKTVSERRGGKDTHTHTKRFLRGSGNGGREGEMLEDGHLQQGMVLP